MLVNAATDYAALMTALERIAAEGLRPPHQRGDCYNIARDALEAVRKSAADRPPVRIGAIVVGGMFGGLVCSEPNALAGCKVYAIDFDVTSSPPGETYGDRLFAFEGDETAAVYRFPAVDHWPLQLAQIEEFIARREAGEASEAAAAQAPNQPFDNRQASAEGWAIFAGNDAYKLCRIDDDGDRFFAGDGEAWLHVFNRASGGSQYHRNALEWLRINSPDEHKGIMEHVHKATREAQA